MIYDASLWLLLGCLYLAVGSFLNVVIHRLPLMILQPQAKVNLCLPASFCPSCRVPLRYRDNIPLLSWLWLEGRCHHCRASISPRYPLVELASLLLGLLLTGLLPLADLPVALVFVWALLILSLIDWQHQLLPDAITLPLLWLGLLLHCFDLLPGNLSDAVLGAACGYGLFWLLASGYRHLRGVEALGLGDAKLLAALGGWLGWQPLPMLVLIAACGGIISVLLARWLRRRPLQQSLPFGPWLSLAGGYGLMVQLL